MSAADSSATKKRRRIETEDDDNPIVKSATLRIKTFDIPLTASATGSHVDTIRLTPDKPQFTIGRSRSVCQFVFEEQRRVVSKRHCQILFDAVSGDVCVLDGFGGDTVSLNGVFVNGIRNGVGEAVVLREGDVVGLGCRNVGVCGDGNGILGFVVESIVLEEVYGRMLSGDFGVEFDKGNGLGLRRIDCIIGRANYLLSCCKRVLDSADPVSSIKQLQISDVVLSFGSKFLQQGTEQNNAASRVVGCEDSDIKRRRSFINQERDSTSVRILENKLSCQCVSKAKASLVEVSDTLYVPPHFSVLEDNPSDELKEQPLYSKVVDDTTVDRFQGEKGGGISLPPPGKKFYLNNLQSANFAPSGDHVFVSLPELLHPVESLSRVFIATFTSDIPWFLGSCEIPVHLPVTIACHNTERCWSANPESRFSSPLSDFPKLVVVYPPFPEAIAFGSDRTKRGVACHHPKLLMMLREHSVRVIITSANLVEKQWNSVTNTVWWQDFPRATAPDFLSLFSCLPDTSQVCRSDFAAQLAKLVATLVTDVPSQAYWVAELANYDFHDASGHLVVSIPGIHSLAPPYLYESKLSSFSAHMAPSLRHVYLCSADAFVVGLSHLFCSKADSNGLQLKKLASYFANCRTTAYGMLEVVLRRNKSIPADANAVSVFVPNQDNISEGDCVQLGFLPRDVARWVSPLWDADFFSFSGYISPKEAIEVALGKTSGKKVRLSLQVAQGPQFSKLSRMMHIEHVVALCSLIASIPRCAGLWRLQEVIGRYSWPEPLETDFVYGSSSIGSSISPQFLATFAAAIGKKALNFHDSEESDPEWGRWSASQESKNPSMKILFPSIERVKNSRNGMMPSKRILCLQEKTWQRLRPAGIFHDAVPHPEQRVGHPMHVKVAMRRFQSKTDSSSFGWVYCGSHNFSAAAWGRVMNTRETKRSLSDEMHSSSHNSPGPKLHICNYEVGIVFLFPPTGTKKSMASLSRQDNTNIDNIVLPFVVPPPKYKPSDRPATFQALREALLIELAKHKSQPLPQDDVLEEEEEEEEKMIEEEPGDIVEAMADVREENEDDKAYAEELWSQVDSSQS
ncbi:unnamed protein product [Rhodiola kirilowii]